MSLTNLYAIVKHSLVPAHCLKVGDYFTHDFSDNEYRYIYKVINLEHPTLEKCLSAKHIDELNKEHLLNTAYNCLVKRVKL